MSLELGKKLVQIKQFKKAFIVIQNLLKDKPKDFRNNFLAGQMYYGLNDLEKSYTFFQKCDEIKPNTPSAIFNLALILQAQGKIENAKEKYLNLISINKNDVKSYYGLFILDNNNINNKHRETLKNINNEVNTPLFEKSIINFMFSKFEKKKENFKKEVDFLKIAHQLSYDSNKSYNSQSDFYYKNIISNNFNKLNFKDDFKELKNFNDTNHIFIVGLPRSGSTLIETIISHNAKKIVSVGEFHAINTSILEQIGSIIYSKDFDLKDYKLSLNKKIFQNSIFNKYDNFEKKIYIDKSLENFFNIEIILEFFPNAKFVHTHRNTNDAIIGIYQTLLTELSWSHKIKDIKNYVKIYNNVINYFNEKYPNKIINVELDNFANHKEAETKRILEFCNIEVTNDFLNFDKNTKLFNKTNSFLQVRKKIEKYNRNKYQPYYYLLD
ncbi:sulfotransferase [Candidatus Pelagibacter sp.]|nr:sulfotransferase [Candidatus Pelagibacter sp.]